jgi:hypothetical protein
MKFLSIITLFSVIIKSKSFSNQRVNCCDNQRLRKGKKFDQNVCQSIQQTSRQASRPLLSMHMGHSHGHHDHAHENSEHEKHEKVLTGPEVPFSLWGQLLRPRETFLRRPPGKVFLAALLVGIPAIMRKRFNKIDLGVFILTSVALTIFDSVKFAVKRYRVRVGLGLGLEVMVNLSDKE